VKPGETLELGTIALGRGVGVIEGQVTALHAGRDHPIVVQLYGDGRSPCDRCLGLLERPPEEKKADNGGAPVAPLGSDCAFSDARDELTLQGGGAFRFEHLAAGIYWLRASDPEQRIVEARRIELGRGGRFWQNLDVSAPTKARFELRHDGGGLFTGAWSAVHKANPAAIHYEFRRRGRAVAGVDVAPTADDCLASVGPPIAIPGRERQPPANLNEGRYTVRFFQSVRVESGSDLRVGQLFYNAGKGWAAQPAEPDDRDDRTKKEGDALLVDGGEPDCDPGQLAAKALRPDLHEIAPLPRAELSVVVSCGDYKSDETAINLCDPFRRSSSRSPATIRRGCRDPQGARIVQCLPRQRRADRRPRELRRPAGRDLLRLRGRLRRADRWLERPRDGDWRRIEGGRVAPAGAAPAGARGRPLRGCLGRPDQDRL
jgi:hypothetical protein